MHIKNAPNRPRTAFFQNGQMGRERKQCPQRRGGQRTVLCRQPALPLYIGGDHVLQYGYESGWNIWLRSYLSAMARFDPEAAYQAMLLLTTFCPQHDENNSRLHQVGGCFLFIMWKCRNYLYVFNNNIPIILGFV